LISFSIYTVHWQYMWSEQKLIENRIRPISKALNKLGLSVANSEKTTHYV